MKTNNGGRVKCSLIWRSKRGEREERKRERHRQTERDRYRERQRETKLL